MNSNFFQDPCRDCKPIAKVNRRDLFNSKAGFTLIEVLIVLAIIAGIIGIGVPRILRSENNIKKVTREFAVMGKMIRNEARLKGVTYRLVIRLDEGNQAYWVENASSPVLISPEDLNEKKDEDEEKKSPFSLSKSITKDEKSLPSNLFFAQVENSQAKEPIKTGTAYIYFSPQGLVEASALQITNKDKLTWTLVFSPLTGQADIVKEALSIKDLRR